MATFFAKLSPCLIGMEACASSHYWGRVLTGVGHTVKLPAIQEDAENGLTGDFKVLLHGLHNDLITLDGRVAELDRTMQ